MVRVGRLSGAFPRRVVALAGSLEYSPPLASVDACVQRRAHDQALVLGMPREIEGFLADILLAGDRRGLPPSWMVYPPAVAAEHLLSGIQYCILSQAIAIDDGGVVSRDA